MAEWGKDAWVEPTPDEYEALGLDDKIRHHTIMQNRYELRAGPMWNAEGRMQPEDMPDEWHRWRGRAAWHAEEAKGLREAMARAKLGREEIKPRGRSWFSLGR